MEISRQALQEKWKHDNPQIPFAMYEINYGFRMLETCTTFNITDGGKVILRFTTATEYFDTRKPNEIQTTD